MNKPIRVLEWIDRLPEVGDPIRKHRDAINNRLKLALVLERRATEARTEALAQAEQLERRLGELWTNEEIARAKGAKQ